MGYYTKLCELEKQLEMQKERLEEVQERVNKIRLLRSSDELLYQDTALAIVLSKTIICGKILEKEISETELELKKMRYMYHKYNQEHSNDFYGLTDDIDIVMTINRNGNIRGTIL